MKLSDRDLHYGPLTVGISNSKSFMWSLYVSTDCDDGDAPKAGNKLFLFTPTRWQFCLNLPRVFKPVELRKTYNTDSGEERVYKHYLNKEYGLTISDDNLWLRYGVQDPMDNATDTVKPKVVTMSLGWKRWSFQGYRLFDPQGRIHAWVLETEGYEVYRGARETCPKLPFEIIDYDGEHIKGSCFVVERTWHKGEGWWRWLSWFSKPLVRKCLEINFDSEVGERKGSWKGGLMGTGIEMQDGESAQQALERFCAGQGSGTYTHPRQLTLVNRQALYTA